MILCTKQALVDINVEFRGIMSNFIVFTGDACMCRDFSGFSKALFAEFERAEA